MSVTAQNFWADMTEQYGARWLKNRGSVPSAAWIEVIDACSAEHLARVVQEIKAKHPTHPITQGELEKLIKATAGLVLDQRTLTGYWASVIVASIQQLGAMRLFRGEALWEFGAQLRARWDGDSRVIRGSLGVDANRLARELIERYVQRELAGEERGALNVEYVRDVQAGLQRLESERRAA
jgi:hypothetical protein